MDSVTIATIVCSSISAIAMITLVAVTCLYVWHTGRLVEATKIARRDDPVLKVYTHDPSDYEWLKMEISNIPRSDYLRIKALLVNPGLVPIVINDIKETVKDETGVLISTNDMLATPLRVSPETYALYIFGLSWVIMSDLFAIWCKIFELPRGEELVKDRLYTLTLYIDYEVGEKRKSAMKDIQLTAHRGSGEKVTQAA